jgi:hypothetical protein
VPLLHELRATAPDDDDEANEADDDEADEADGRVAAPSGNLTNSVTDCRSVIEFVTEQQK